MKTFYFIVLISIASQVFGQKAKKSTAVETCVKCNIEMVILMDTAIDHLTPPIVRNFLCTFDKSCTNNSEFSEISNAVLFKLVDINPTLFLTVFKDLAYKNKEVIINELEKPLLDFNLPEISDKVKAVKTASRDKGKVLKALKSGIKYQKQHPKLLNTPD